MNQGIPQRVLGKLIGANMNTTADQAIYIAVPKYYTSGIFCTNPSISLTTCAGGFYTATSKGGTAVVAAGQVYSSLTAASKIFACTLNAASDTRTEATIYLSLTTGQGVAATMDLFVLGWPFYE